MKGDKRKRVLNLLAEYPEESPDWIAERASVSKAYVYVLRQGTQTKDDDVPEPMSAIPPLTESGAYEPSALKAWLHENRNLTPYQMSKLLNVSMDRIYYLLGDGRSMLFRTRTPV